MTALPATNGLVSKARSQLFRYGLAVRAGAYVCMLPPLLRFCSLPAVLQQFALTGAPKRQKAAPELLQETVRVVVGVCQLRPFRMRLFPRACLRQSIVLYRLLGRLGYPVRIHFGVRKQGAPLEGHSWVTLNGEPVAERTPPHAFVAIYSYPVAEKNATHPKDGVSLQGGTQWIRKNETLRS